MTQYSSGGGITETISATGAGTEEFTPTPGRPVLFARRGTWTGTAKVQISLNGGTTWDDITVGDTAWATFTGNGATAVDEASHARVRYRAHFTRSSGSLEYYLGH